MNKNKLTAENNPLQKFVVIDEMKVGPVLLTEDKLSMPYLISLGNEEHLNHLEYKFEEPVFHLSEKSSLNLATMMGLQVALNYGIFCKKISFIGSFDSTDRRFIADMMENTSREIYVKKLLEENPFLIDEFKGISAVQMKRYTQAELVFNDGSGERHKWEFWHTDKLKHCILSSGGKDSLLSYGLLNEIGKETHPIFINESGRHWFTAINSYKYFKEHVENTARVWTNSDRIFSWMLRHLPFIRQDFANVRSDEYPIRLWTVAVFLFGVLPLMKKRGIGRLLIGDEYDTTRRKSYKGITHYDGLFDQSRYFDETMSRYFMKKGWAISQFSVLRPVSEMLIQKILAKRYPELQQHQVSCHASHKEGDRIYPCGKCEKCRRIVGILKAVDEDPHRCGYNETQIDHCLKELSTKNINQIGEDARQLNFMLWQKGLINAAGKSKSELKEHTNTLKIRFDNERAPVNSIPTDLRRRLYQIYLGYANGAIRKKGTKWLDFDLINDPAMDVYFPFELDPDVKEKFSSEDTTSSRANYLWGELNWPDAGDRLQEVDIAILPVGAIEQHGPHLPLDTDAFDADYLAKRIAEACSDPKPLVLPLVSYGVSYHHDDFPGTISISNDTLANLVYDIGMALARNGIKKLLILNGHGDNSPTLRYAAQMINKDAKIFTCVDTGETSDIDIDKLTETTNDVHAGEVETSTTLAIRPHLVKMERALTEIPGFTTRYLNFSSVRGIPWYAYTKRISDSGIMGDPTKATAEKGEKMWEIMIAHLVALVEDLKSLTLDEIFQKRY
ncbi:MAG: creatininase family protein [Bacteroidetes bacterium]|nr:creatininase family protein [Bacteroidota bacterium]